MFILHKKALTDAAEKGIEAWVTYLEKDIGAKFNPIVRASQMRNDPNALLSLMKAYTETWPSAADILPKINVPTLVYAGDADNCFADAKEATGKMPKATFIPLPGFTHGQGYWRIDIILPQVREFLDGIKTD